MGWGIRFRVYTRGRGRPFIYRGGAGWTWAGLKEPLGLWAAVVSLFFSCRARAVSRARVAAQARPADSGRAGTGPTATVLGRARPGPKQRAVGRANGPRTIWKSIAAGGCGVGVADGEAGAAGRHSCVAVLILVAASPTH